MHDGQWDYKVHSGSIHSGSVKAACIAALLIAEKEQSTKLKMQSTLNYVLTFFYYSFQGVGVQFKFTIFFVHMV